jgi:hypothetical protein
MSSETETFNPKSKYAEARELWAKLQEAAKPHGTRATIACTGFMERGGMRVLCPHRRAKP